MARILYVQHNPEVSGSTLSLLYLLEQLDPARYEPTVLFHTGDGPGVDLFRRRGVPTVVRDDISFYAHSEAAHFTVRSERPWRPITELLRIWPSALRMRAYLGSHRFDLVHLNSSFQAPAALGARLAGVPIVWHVRERLWGGLLGVRLSLLRYVIDVCADRVIAISGYQAEGLRPSERISIIPNFVDFRHFDRSISPDGVRAEFGLSDHAPVVGMLGGSLPHKGALTLVDAAAVLRQEFPHLRVLIIGCRPRALSPSRYRRLGRRVVEGVLAVEHYGERVERLVRELGLDATVTLVGVRTDVPALLAALDVLVFPATAPHFARPVVEAGAMAKPVIATGIGGAGEFVQDGVTGYLVPQGDPERLAGALRQLLADPPLARSMGEAGYAQAREKFDAGRNAARIAGVYEEILSASAAAPGRRLARRLARAGR